MDGKLSARLERLLLAERDRTLAALHHAQEDEAQAQSVTGGGLARTQWTLAEAASDAQEEAADFITVTRAGDHLEEIDDALRMLVDDPDALFRCAPCGKSVERERLELVPWTRLCAACARADERTPSL